MKREHTVSSLLKRGDNMLTIIVIPTGKKRTEELIESFAGIPADVILLEDGKLDFNVKVKTVWKIFMYEGEFLSKELCEALPVYLESGKDFDVFSIYKMTTSNGASIAPRLFKADIKIKNDSVFPVDVPIEKQNTILDGFILGV
jgi:hypothetical protein